jgi:hypothetical protein
VSQAGKKSVKSMRKGSENQRSISSCRVVVIPDAKWARYTR